MTLPTVAGVLTADQVSATIDSIAADQLPSGLIPWARGVHGDAWNHTEAVMALALGGRWREAERAYDWLIGSQRPDGSWHQYYLADGVEEPKLDANICAYPATGVWHHWLLTRDRGFIETMWPMVERAIDFVLDLQTARGEVRWARHVDGTPWPYALLTGSSSISHSLRCAIALAEELGLERPDWELSAAALVRTIRHDPEAFLPKERWAMDWYYPVLVGALRGEPARDRLEAGWERFVMEGRGVRCVSDRPWVTAAETCECALAALGADLPERALALFCWAQQLRTDDGAYFTGLVHPQQVTFPSDERSTYTAAAVVLAADALSHTTPASGLFVDHDLLPSVDGLEAELDLD
ncbi:MAG TPA: hypothetical protein VGH94_05270 [Acidimicrobiales bacterium]|jgi:hypothetical protein